MAQRVVIELEDDLDGSEAAETVQFSLDQHRYEIDLNAANAQELRGAFSRYIDVARPAGKRPAKKQPAARNSPNTKEIRAWAQQQGIDVNARGRISESVIEQFNKEHSS